MSSPGSLKILLAEDEDDIRRLLRAFFSARGHEVFDACNGVEALEKFASS